MEDRRDFSQDSVHQNLQNRNILISQTNSLDGHPPIPGQLIGQDYNMHSNIQDINSSNNINSGVVQNSLFSSEVPNISYLNVPGYGILQGQFQLTPDGNILFVTSTPDMKQISFVVKKVETMPISCSSNTQRTVVMSGVPQVSYDPSHSTLMYINQQTPTIITTCVNPCLSYNQINYPISKPNQPSHLNIHSNYQFSGSQRDTSQPSMTTKSSLMSTPPPLQVINPTNQGGQGVPKTLISFPTKNHQTHAFNLPYLKPPTTDVVLREVCSEGPSSEAFTNIGNLKTSTEFKNVKVTQFQKTQPVDKTSSRFVLNTLEPTLKPSSRVLTLKDSGNPSATQGTSEISSLLSFRIPKKDQEVAEKPIKAKKAFCDRSGCKNLAKYSKLRGSNYCSDDCVVHHCRQYFDDWIMSNTAAQTIFNK